MDTIKMRTCSFLLPDPGGEVLREALGEIERLVAELEDLKKTKLRKTCIHVNIAGDCSAIQRLKKERDEAMADAARWSKRVQDHSCGF